MSTQTPECATAAGPPCLTSVAMPSTSNPTSATNSISNDAATDDDKPSENVAQSDTNLNLPQNPDDFNASASRRHRRPSIGWRLWWPRKPPPAPYNHNNADANDANNTEPPNNDRHLHHHHQHHHHHHHTSTSNNWLPFVVIFASGVSCSIFIMLTLNANLFGTNPSAPHRRQFHQLPAANYLQVRDEFNVMPADSGTVDDTDYTPLSFKRASAKQTKTTSQSDQQEALSTLRVAIDLRAAGNDDKALRLFKHALALAPRNPDVLTNYGEYLEHSRRDVLLADLMYTQALSVQPDHRMALANRRRTASIVDALDSGRLAELDEKRDAISAIHESNAALRRAKKEAYFQNIYHSVGIEGNTMTLSQTRSVLETRMAVHGKSIDEHNEILGLDAAMKYINATLVNQSGYITMQDILEVHRRVLGHVDPVEGGELRRTQVYVGGHVPPGPGDLSVLMVRFEQWLNSVQAMAMHPVRLAALAHYRLVHIHPFVDGNGRTSRLLMNTILMRSGYPPVIIPKQQRHKYYDFLQLANEGDTRPFVRFVADCTEKTLDLFLWATSDLAAPAGVPLLAQMDEDGGAGGGAGVLGKVIEEQEAKVIANDGSGSGSDGWAGELWEGVGRRVEGGLNDGRF